MEISRMLLRFDPLSLRALLYLNQEVFVFLRLLKPHHAIALHHMRGLGGGFCEQIGVKWGPAFQCYFHLLTALV